MVAAKKPRKERPAPRKNTGKEHLSVRAALAKAAVLTGRAVDESAALQAINRSEVQYGEQGAVEPPYNPESLLNYVELTPHLTPCIDAYKQNIEGYGYQWDYAEPWMEDLESPEARKAVENALLIERLVDEEEAAFEATQEQQDKANDGLESEGDPAGDSGGDSIEVTDEEVDQALKQLEVELLREQFRFDAFFKNCCSIMSFTKLRRITRQDIESNGWGAWEMLMDGFGTLKRLNYIPGYTVRPLKDEGELVEVQEDDPVTPLSDGRQTMVRRRFRRYVQIVGSQKSFFKSPGDPRVISRTTGKVYESVEDLRRPEDAQDNPGEGKDAQEANQLMYIALHDPRTPCPPPRWVGNLLAVLGVREADESNYFYLESNAIPPGILFVAGGKVPPQIKDRLEQRMTQELGGAENSHKIMVVEAHPMKLKGEERTMLPSMEFQSLRDAQQNDATFTNFDERSADRIGASFRLSPILRGYTPDNLNRATATTAVAFAEQQVFQPEREDIDWLINRDILPPIKVKLLKFRSNSPPTRSPEEIAELIKVSAPHGGLLPYEIRSLLGDALNRTLTKIEEEWAKKPMPMTLSGIGGTTADSLGEEGTTVANLMAQMDEMSKRVESIVTAELRGIGVDAAVTANWRGLDEIEVEDDGQDSDE